MSIRHEPRRLGTAEEQAFIRSALVAVSKAHFGPALAQQVERCLKLGRNTRSLLFLRASSTLASRQAVLNADQVLFAIEASHAASILVDDLLDGDSLRHGLPTTASLWGAGRAALTSHLLTSSALRSVADRPYLSERLLRCYASMCVAEARDVHLGAARLGLESYAAQIIPKTATLFGFALEAAAHLNADNRCEAFRLLGESIGEIYQLSNDYYDLQPEALKARHSPLDYWCETASFPIVVFADLHPYELVPIESLGKSLSYSEWEALLALIWQDDVREFCQAHMAEKVKCATTLAREMSLPDALYDLCCSIIEQVQDSTFWFNVYEE